MKKKILCLAMLAVMAVGVSAPVQAKEYEGKDGWLVEFDGDGLVSNFESSDITDEAKDIQPGDSITLKVRIKNSDSAETDWYMSNEVLQTLEEAQDSADGGGYEYRLTYTDPSGEVTVIYDSETVGGEEDSESGEGLHQATDSLEEYFWIDRLSQGESGKISLRLAVDGETTGNGYQETFASLQMNFAVEEAVRDEDPDSVPGSSSYTTIVKTGDTSRIMLLSVTALASGLICLLMALHMLNRKRRAYRQRGAWKR